MRKSCRHIQIIFVYIWLALYIWLLYTQSIHDLKSVNHRVLFGTLWQYCYKIWCRIYTLARASHRVIRQESQTLILPWTTRLHSRRLYSCLSASNHEPHQNCCTIRFLFSEFVRKTNYQKFSNNFFALD